MKVRFGSAQRELDRLLVEERQRAEQEVTNLSDEHGQRIQEYEKQKERLETQLSELRNNLSQVSKQASIHRTYS